MADAPPIIPGDSTRATSRAARRGRTCARGRIRRASTRPSRSARRDGPRFGARRMLGRRPARARRARAHPPDMHGIAVLSVPILGGDLDAAGMSLGDIYRHVLERRGAPGRRGPGARRRRRVTGGRVLFGGQGRTGLVTALVLGAASWPEERLAGPEGRAAGGLLRPAALSYNVMISIAVTSLVAIGFPPWWRSRRAWSAGSRRRDR